MKRHFAPISGVATCGSLVATMGYDNQVILWDHKSRQPIARANHDHLANTGAFSPDGRYLVTASSDHTARLWSVPDLKLLACYAGHRDDVDVVAFHPTGAQLATASHDGDIHLYALSGGDPLLILEGHTDPVLSLTFSGDGTEIISSGDDGFVRRWDGRTGTLLQSISMDQVQTDAVVCTEAGLLFAGTDTGTIVRIGTDGGVQSVVPAHASGVKLLVYSAFNQALVSASYDRSGKLWSIASDGTLHLEQTFLLPCEIWPRACAFVGEGQLVWGTFGSEYATFHLGTGQWDHQSIRPTPGLNSVMAWEEGWLAVGDSGTVINHHAEVVSRPGSLCNFLVRAGTHVFTGGHTGELFDAMSGMSLYQHHSPLNCGTAWKVEDGQYRILIGTYTGEALVFALLEDGSMSLLHSLPLHENAIKSVACAEGILFSICSTGAAMFHRVDDFACIQSLLKAHSKIANGCVSLGNGRFASVSRDRNLYLWQEGRVRIVETPHTHSVKCCAWNGEYIATGAYNGRIAVFHPATRQWTTCRPTTSGISSLSATSGGEFLASSYDGSVYRSNSSGSTWDEGFAPLRSTFLGT